MRRWAALECGAIGASLLGPRYWALRFLYWSRLSGLGPSLLGPQVLVLVKTLGAGQPHTSRSRIRPAAYKIHVLLGLDPLGYMY